MRKIRIWGVKSARDNGNSLIEESVHNHHYAILIVKTRVSRWRCDQFKKHTKGDTGDNVDSVVA